MVWVALIIFIVLILAAWLGWQNRKSERIKEVVLPGLAITFSVALIALLQSPSAIFLEKMLQPITIFAVGALVTILISLKSSKRHVEFPAAFIIDQGSKMPLRHLPFTLGFPPQELETQNVVARMIEMDPSLCDEESKSGDLYFDVLLRLVLISLFTRYMFNWDVRTRIWDLPFHRRSSWYPPKDAPEPDFLTWDYFKNLFQGNPILEVELPPHIRKLALPTHTEVKGKTESGQNGPFTRALLIEDSFTKLCIKLTRAGGSLGIGDLRLVLGKSYEESQKYFSWVFIIEVSAKFSYLRSGHPEMPTYVRWVDAMIEMLQTEFDARRHWEQAKDRYLLLKDEIQKGNN